MNIWMLAFSSHIINISYLHSTTLSPPHSAVSDHIGRREASLLTVYCVGAST